MKYKYFPDYDGGFIATDDGQTQVCDFREGMGDSLGEIIADALSHGGKRPGSGRKPTGAKTVTRSLSMPEAAWQAFDSKCGNLARGEYLMRLMGFK